MPLLIFALILGAFSIKPTNALEPARFILRDYVFLVIAFTSFIFATEQAASHGWLSAMAIGLFLVSFACLMTFYILSQRSNHPLINVAVFKQPTFLFSLSFILMIQFCVLALGYLIPNYAQIVSGSSAFISGFLLLPGCLIGAAIAPISGKLLDQLGAKKPIIAGSLTIILALALFSLFGQGLTTALIIGFYVIYTIGQGFSVGNTMTHALRQLDSHLSADGNAVINTLQQLAGAVGTSVVSTIVASEQHNNSELSQGTMFGTQYAFILLTVLALLALLSVLRVFKQSPN